MDCHEMPRLFPRGFHRPSRNLDCSVQNWRKSRWSDLHITGETMMGRIILIGSTRNDHVGRFSDSQL